VCGVDSNIMGSRFRYDVRAAAEIGRFSVAGSWWSRTLLPFWGPTEFTEGKSF
jgi:hypothetical protein